MWESEYVLDATRLMLRILDANDKKYEQSNIEPERKHLSNDKQGILYNVLTKYELLLGNWKIKPVYIELHTGDKPYHSESYLDTLAQKYIFKK